MQKTINRDEQDYGRMTEYAQIYRKIQNYGYLATQYARAAELRITIDSRIAEIPKEKLEKIAELGRLVPAIINTFLSEFGQLEHQQFKRTPEYLRKPTIFIDPLGFYEQNQDRVVRKILSKLNTELCEAEKK